MKRFAKLFLTLLVVLSCSQEDILNTVLNNIPEEEEEPAITEIGVPIGEAVTKEIGPGGGTISSGDGMLDIVVPSGAVTANTTFSIQPVSNFCPGGLNAYELLPEGTRFANPVTLTFHYTEEELEGTSTDFFGIAFQGPDRIWYVMPPTIDTQAKTITTRATHFTNWTRLSRLNIAPVNPRVPQVEVDKTLNLVLTGSGDTSPHPLGVETPEVSGDDLPRLPQRVPFVAKWFVNGVENGNANVGRISVSSDNINVTYTAPSSEPANNPVAISVQLTNFRAWDFVNRRHRSFNNVILFKHVKIIDEYKYKLKLTVENDQMGCAEGDQHYKDVAEMDIKVKNNVVTISHIENQNATIEPETVPFADDANCVITCSGGTGHLNISSADGAILDGDGKKRYLHIAFENTGAAGPVLKHVCNSNGPFPSSSVPDQTYALDFILKDSAQTRNVVFKWELTPQH